jgi:hypothetical protein
LSTHRNEEEDASQSPTFDGISDDEPSNSPHNHVFFDSPMDSVTSMNPSMHSYFKQELEKEGSGISQIIHLAFGNRKTRDLSQLPIIRSEEIDYHLEATFLTASLTRSQRSSFGNMISDLTRHYLTPALVQKHLHQSVLLRTLSGVDMPESLRQMLLKSFEQVCERGLPLVSSIPTSVRLSADPLWAFQHTRPPTNSHDLERIYVTSPNSIYNNIPSPTVYLTPDQLHAYVKIEEVCAFFFACQVNEPSHFPTIAEVAESIDTGVIPNFHHSPTAYRNMLSQLSSSNSEPTFVVPFFIKEWSDDAEKNNTRSNTLSFNIRTVTFMKVGSNGDLRFYNFIVSLGVKGDDSRVVEEIHHREFRKLKVSLTTVTVQDDLITLYSPSSLGKCSCILFW